MEFKGILCPFVDDFCIFPSGMSIFNHRGNDFIQKNITVNNSGLMLKNLLIIS